MGKVGHIEANWEETVMKKNYEKPAFIMELYDTSEIICSDPDSEFCKRFFREAEKVKKESRPYLHPAVRTHRVHPRGRRIMRLSQRSGHVCVP